MPTLFHLYMLAHTPEQPDRSSGAQNKGINNSIKLFCGLQNCSDAGDDNTGNDDGVTCALMKLIWTTGTVVMRVIR